MTGSNHISQYRQPSLPVQTGTYSDGRPIYTFYAENAAQNGPTFNVSDYGATGDGVTDDVNALNAALSAAYAAGGGTVQLPAGTYATSAAVVIPGSRVVLRGAGWNTVIKPMAGATYDAVTLPLPPNNTVTGYVANYVGISDLMIDCSNVAGTVVGQGNGIHFFGARWSYIRNVYVLNCPNFAICCDANGTDAGYNNQLEQIHTDGCGGGIHMEHEASNMLNCVIDGANAALAAAQPLFGSTTYGNHIHCVSGRHQIYGCVFGSLGTQNQSAIVTENGQTSRIVMCSFDTVKAAALYSQGGNVVFAFNELISPGNAGGSPALALNYGNNFVIGNTIDGGGAVNWTYAVAEDALPNPRNVIIGNTFTAGTAGLFSLYANSPSVLRDNAGYNPLGHAMTQPAIPASGTAQSNTFGVDATVYVTGGTVTAIAVGGVATGLTAGAFRVPAGQTITLTYSAAPTWQWFGD